MRLGLRAAALLVCAGTAVAQEPMPSLAALEAAGAVIGEVRIVGRDIFDLSDPAENGWLYRLANGLHVQTREGVIRRQLLFRSGEKLVAQRIEESERLLRGNSSFYEAHIRPVAYRDGVVDIDVVTRDSWSIETGASVRRAGGITSGGANLRETNLLGTGLRLGISTHGRTATSSAGQARNTVNFDVAYPYALDGRTTLAYAESSFSEGDSSTLSVSRPFYALDARGAGAFQVSRDNRLFTRYADGATAGRFRKVRQDAEISGGWSAGLVEGWAHRFSLGMTFARERYLEDPADPAVLPEDRTLYTPFVRYEAVENDFREVTNVESIHRPEYLALGLRGSAQIGRSLAGLGSTQSVTQYVAGISKGLRFRGERTLLLASSLSGEYAKGKSDRLQWGASARYFQRRGSGALLYLALSADATKYSDATQYLSLGGDTGLRGYPASYQIGDRRVLLTIEQRWFSDWYPFRLVRVGGALFYDVGRAWGGPYQSGPDPRWRADAGFGLRLLSARSSSGTTVHIDFAFPIERAPGLETYQVTIESKSGF